jgi:two-component system sensor histidine kinase HydH
VLDHPLFRWIRLIRPHDLVWVLLFSGLLAVTQFGDAYEIVPLILLGIAQILESKIPAAPTNRSRIFWILLKLALGWVLIGFSGGVNSPFWLVLLLPVGTAATTFGIGGTLLAIALSSGTYLTFLTKVHEAQEVTVDLGLRIIFIAIVGNLVNILALELRAQSRRHQQTALELAYSNAQLQKAEEEIRRSERLAALGQLSAGLAHELRNPLGTIRASSEMIARNVSAENEVTREMAGFIATEVDRCNSLITRFLQFARPLQIKTATADLAQTIDRAVDLVQREAPQIAIYKNYEPEIRPFPFDAELMERVLYNLLLNAAQASTAGGTVTVKTRAAAGAVEIGVIDRGGGIGQEHIKQIFNPFFTTKPDGVGLGLAIVAKIIDEHGGKITVESDPGKGSVFRVLLPTTPPSEAPTAQSPLK